MLCSFIQKFLSKRLLWLFHFCLYHWLTHSGVWEYLLSKTLYKCAIEDNCVFLWFILILVLYSLLCLEILVSWNQLMSAVYILPKFWKDDTSVLCFSHLHIYCLLLVMFENTGVLKTIYKWLVYLSRHLNKQVDAALVFISSMRSALLIAPAWDFW